MSEKVLLKLSQALSLVTDRVLIQSRRLEAIETRLKQLDGGDDSEMASMRASARYHAELRMRRSKP
jgi:hypothetical protein